MAEVRVIPSPIEGLAGAVVVKLEGAFNARCLHELQAALETLQDDGNTRFVLSFAGVRFIDSSTAGFLVNFLDSVRRDDGDVVLAALGPNVRLVLDTLGVSGILSIFDTVEEASESFG